MDEFDEAVELSLSMSPNWLSSLVMVAPKPARRGEK